MSSSSVFTANIACAALCIFKVFPMPCAFCNGNGNYQVSLYLHKLLNKEGLGILVSFLPFFIIGQHAFAISSWTRLPLGPNPIQIKTQNCGDYCIFH